MSLNIVIAAERQNNFFSLFGVEQLCSAVFTGHVCVVDPSNQAITFVDGNF